MEPPVAKELRKLVSDIERLAAACPSSAIVIKPIQVLCDHISAITLSAPTSSSLLSNGMEENYMEHPLVKELRDQAALRSKTLTPPNMDPFTWRKTTVEWRAAAEIERLMVELNTACRLGRLKELGFDDAADFAKTRGG